MFTVSKLAQWEHRVLDEAFREEAVNESALNPGGRSPNALVRRHFGQCHHSTLQSLTPAICNGPITSGPERGYYQVTTTREFFKRLDTQ